MDKKSTTRDGTAQWWTGQEIWCICRTLGWHRSHLRHDQDKDARIVCLIDAQIPSRVHADTLQRRDGTRSTTPGAELMGLSDGATAGG